MSGQDELTAGLQAELARVNARLAEQQCRPDGRCQYAIDSGAEGAGHCPPGKCCMPAQRPVKTYHGGKAWPVAPSDLNPEHIIRQLVTALEGSGTRLRTDQWYVEIEAVAAGKRYLAEMALLGREKMDEEHRAGFDGPPED
jgi:hypothetical protein